MERRTRERDHFVRDALAGLDHIPALNRSQPCLACVCQLLLSGYLVTLSGVVRHFAGVYLLDVLPGSSGHPLPPTSIGRGVSDTRSGGPPGRVATSLAVTSLPRWQGVLPVASLTPPPRPDQPT
jgi:hypothetical protein